MSTKNMNIEPLGLSKNENKYVFVLHGAEGHTQGRTATDNGAAFANLV